MAKIKIQQFKGLLDYGDLADSSLEYAKELTNVKVYPGYIESIGFKFTSVNFNIPSGENLIKIFYAFLDNDKYKNKVNGNTLVRDYQQDIQKHQIIISEKQSDDYSEYYVYVDGQKIEDFIHTGAKNQEPIYENLNGILKIFFKETSYYLSKFDRYIRRFVVTPVTSQWTYQDYRGIKINKLIRNEVNTFPFTIEQITEDLPLTVPARLEIVGRAIYYWQGDQFVVLSCKLINELNNETLIYPSENGYFNFILTRHRETDYYHYFAVNTKERDIIVNLDSLYFREKNVSGSLLNFYRNMTDWQMYGAPNEERFHLVYTDPSFTDYSNIPLTGYEVNLAKLQTYYNEFKFNGNTKSEFVATINNSQGEFVHSVKGFDTYPDNFLFKISRLDTSQIPEDTTQINLYLYTTTVLTEDNIFEVKQHDLVLSFSLVDGKLINFPYYIDQLTAKGIYLFQRIGIPYSPILYKLTDGFSQYKTINGVSFAISNDRIYYPAVGNGKVLNNVFYENNYIPSIEGQILTEVSKKLAVIDTNKDITQIIDFQPVENTLVFIPVANYDLQVKNYLDIVSAQEGTILNTRDGIIVTNSQEREIISNQIKNVIKENFDKSKIFYNRFSRELYYTFEDKLYIFDFNMQVWSMSTMLERVDGEIVDIIEDYDNNFYFVVKKRNRKNIYKLEQYLTYGKSKHTSVNLGEITLKKAIKHITFDYEGEVIFNGKKRISSKRTVSTIPVEVLNRKYKNYIEFEYNFKGKLYSIELDLDITPYITY